MTSIGRSLLLLALGAGLVAPVHAQTQTKAQTQSQAKRGTAAPQAGRPPLPKLPESPKVPTTYEGLFAERDARAVAVVGYLGCMQRTLTALRTGALGNVPRAWSITCIQHDGEWRGVFGELTSDGSGFAVRLQYALRGDGRIVKDPVDTAKVNGTARALLRGLSVAAPGKGVAEFLPIPLAQKGYTEVWLLPVPANPARLAIGGDSLIQMTADGTRELGHSLSTPPIRFISIPEGGTSFTVTSVEERLPLLSELVVARMALDMLPEVRIRTRQYESVITRTRRTWTNTQK